MRVIRHSVSQKKHTKLKSFFILFISIWIMSISQETLACHESGIRAALNSGTEGDGSISYTPFITPNGSNYDVHIRWCASVNNSSGLGTSGTIINIAGANVVSYFPASLTSNSSGLVAMGSTPTANQVMYYAPGCDGTSNNCAWHIDQLGLGNTDTDDGTPSNIVSGGLDCFEIVITVDAYPTSVSSEGEQSGANATDTAPNPGTGSTVACGPEPFNFPPAPIYANHTCSDVNFYDSGGNGGNYSDFEDFVYYLCPDNPGDLVTVNFTLVDIEAGFDFLQIYDGYGTANPLTTGNGVQAPTSFTSTSADGCLTATFTTDDSFTLQGWESTLSCTPAPCSPEAGTIAPE